MLRCFNNEEMRARKYPELNGFVIYNHPPHIPAPLYGHPT